MASGPDHSGWFLQRLGGSFRWHVGGIDCDGGHPQPGRWYHVMGTFDGQTARLHVDGRRVAEKAGSPILTPWKGSLCVGQYSGGPGPQYQVPGKIRDLKIFGRLLSDQEIGGARRAAGEL